MGTNNIDGAGDLIRRRGVLFVVSGPSGSGKNRVISEILKKTDRIEYSISATTRQKRSGEVDGKNYYFLSGERFRDMIEHGEFLEYAEVYGNLYGTPKQPIIEKTANGIDVILDVDIQGAKKIQENTLEAVHVFLLPPTIHELERRIRNRGTEDEATIRRRMDSALDEISALTNYTYAVVNDRLDEAVSNLMSIITAERCRTSRIDIEGLVGRLSETI